jgi:ABC-type branched-subunit amino acid transport system substrate-binding protein
VRDVKHRPTFLCTSVTVRALLAALFAFASVPGPIPSAARGYGPGAAEAAPAPEPWVLAVLGSGRDGRAFSAAVAGAKAAATLPGVLPPGRAVEVLALDDLGTEAGLDAAVRTARAKKVLGVVAVPSADLAPAYADAARSWRVPWIVLSSWEVDGVRGGGNVWHLGPSPTSQAIAAADALRSPLAASSVAILHEPTSLGRTLAAAVRRNLPVVAQDLGTREVAAGAEAALAKDVAALKPDWTVALLTGRALEAFVTGLEALDAPPRCLFLDGTRADALLAAAPKVFAASVVLGGPDPEGEGRVGESLLTALEKESVPMAETAVRAAEAARRLLVAAESAGSATPKKVIAALAPETAVPGLLGTLAFEPPGGIRFFPHRLWRVRNGRFEEWPPGALPTPDCGPPLGFGRVPAVPRSPRGRMGWLTFGEKPVRTIEQDLKDLNLTSGGYDPEMDGLVRDEILARAIRIAYRLFRREADGTPIRGWSWGMSLTTEKPADLSPSTTWIAVVAGDDPETGGRVTGANTVAIYPTYLVRTMYAAHKLDPPLTVADKPFLLARHRWGDDKLLDQRAQLVQCLIDGLASAIGMTLAHEFGHLCGCGHDTEHPTSIMNVVAGAGASWADAVWIPSHQKTVTQALGIEGVEK